MKKIYIITSAGGIGNQLMQYSLYLFLKDHNYKCRIYKKPDFLNENHGFDIDDFFKSVSINKNNNIFLNSYIIIFDIIKKIENYLYNNFNINSVFSKYLLPIQIINFPVWENYNFINNFLLTIQEKFTFSNLKSSKNIYISKQISITNSVSIHIRRGDYVTNPKWRLLLGDICDLEYYTKAIKLLNKTIKSPVFFIFSDDPKWVKENLRLDNCFFIDWNLGVDSYIDMQLMALCKHNIIANSTFSSMAACLNTNPNKQVIGPSKWKNCFNDQTALKFMPSEWKTIEINRPYVSLICEIEISEKNIKNIINQTFSDFEILLLDKGVGNDERIKDLNIHSASGKYIFQLELKTLSYFSNRNYLRTILFKNFIK